MAFSFNAALINDELNVNKEHSKINKESLNKLLTSTPSLSKEKPSSIDVANIHANLKEDNEEELNNFYEKETKPPVIHTEPNEDLKGSNHFMLLGDQRMEQYKSPKDNLLQKVNHILQILEEQKEIKTNQKNEEIVLYCFLGLFILYLLDSFVNLGKYSR
jgi:hypothetical protein|tara:strand:- start:336 stop:815 length:480 start_codon:yes stop_codon:yes gene_type:complete